LHGRRPDARPDRVGAIEGRGDPRGIEEGQAWSAPASRPDACSADIDGDDSVGITDLLMVLAEWG
jgi:hypothetical protein